MFESEQNAITVLKKDHEKVKGLFDDFDAADRVQQKVKIAAAVIDELKAHAVIEEEIFYPAMRGTVVDRIMNEANEEHHVAKMLIAELEKMDGSEDRFEAKFRVLAENIRHHIKEEEDKILPKASDAGIDLDDLGEELLARKNELLKKGFPVLDEERLIGAVRGKHLASGRRKKAVGNGKAGPPVIHAKKIRGSSAGARGHERA